MKKNISKTMKITFNMGLLFFDSHQLVQRSMKKNSKYDFSEKQKLLVKNK